MTTNYEAQEKVVSAIYNFNKNNFNMNKNCATRFEDGQEIQFSLKAVEIALEEIMSAFDFEVEPVP